MRRNLFVAGRTLWVLLAVNSIVTFGLTIWVMLQLLGNPSERLTQGLAEHRVSLAVYWAFFVVSTAFVYVIYFGISLLIFLLRPNDGFALVCAIFLLGFGGATATLNLAEFVQFYINAPLWYALPARLVNLHSWTLLVALLVLFPDGRFVPRWSWFVAAIGLVMTAAWSLFPNVFVNAPGALGVLFAMFAPMVTGVSLYVQWWRYRHYYSPMQRQQTKWFILALVIFLANTALFFLLSIRLNSTASPADNVWADMALTLVGSTLGVVFPGAIGIAILRYRLWDVDLIIRKTLIYTSLSALLALIYLGTVVLLQGPFSRLAGVQQSTLAVVLSTLAIAALFTPLRRRIQDAIDRRFFRRKYDAQRVLAQFAQTARNQTDLDALTGALARVVDETLQPDQVSIWLRNDQSPFGRT